MSTHNKMTLFIYLNKYNEYLLLGETLLAAKTKTYCVLTWATANIIRFCTIFVCFMSTCSSQHDDLLQSQHKKKVYNCFRLHFAFLFPLDRNDGIFSLNWSTSSDFIIYHNKNNKKIKLATTYCLNVNDVENVTWYSMKLDPSSKLSNIECKIYKLYIIVSTIIDAYLFVQLWLRMFLYFTYKRCCIS